MDFRISEEHQMLSDMLRRFWGNDPMLEARNGAVYEAPWQAPGVWAELAELGVFGAFLSEAEGGFGGSAEDVVVVFEEAGRALSAEPLLGQLLAMRLLAGLGRADLLEEMVAGASRGALAFAEPALSVDLFRTAATATRRGEGWVLNGRKSAIYGGPGADLLLVTARIDAGLGLFLLRDARLIEAGMVDGGGVAELVMEDLAAECLSQDAGDLVEAALDMGRIALCAEAVGAMEVLTAMTVDYLKQRRQFGRPLATFQALQHRVVDMVMEGEQARSIVIRAMTSYGTPEQARHVAMAKNLIGRVAPHVAEEAIQLHGGIGMTWEYPGSHYAKRLVLLDHQLGDRRDHALRLMRMSAPETQSGGRPAEGRPAEGRLAESQPA